MSSSNNKISHISVAGLPLQKYDLKQEDVMNLNDTPLGYVYNQQKHRYYEIHSVGKQLFYAECEPHDVDEARLFADDTHDFCTNTD